MASAYGGASNFQTVRDTLRLYYRHTSLVTRVTTKLLRRYSLSPSSDTAGKLTIPFRFLDKIIANLQSRSVEESEISPNLENLLSYLVSYRSHARKILCATAETPFWKNGLYVHHVSPDNLALLDELTMTIQYLHRKHQQEIPGRLQRAGMNELPARYSNQ